MEQKRERIVWIDVYKAFCIILVVIGHATGKFNPYIYQFHMAAFFFISGYTARFEGKNLEQVVIDKARALLLPWFTMVVGIVLYRVLWAWIFGKAGFVQGLMMVEEAVRGLLINGNTDSMLGAGWFLPALFFVFAFHRLIWRATEKKHIAVYGVATLAVYLLGYYLQRCGYRQPHCVDMALIGQFFFGMGLLTAKCGWLETLRKKKWCYAVYAAALLWMLLARKLSLHIAGGVTVDYPSRAYPNILATALVPFGGILFSFGISELIGRLGEKRVRLLTKLGSSTLGVLFFHFIGFKIATLLLLPFGVTAASDISSFLLPEAVKVYAWSWLFYTAVSLAFSYGVWLLLMKIPYVNLLLGKKPSQRKQEKETTPCAGER